MRRGHAPWVDAAAPSEAPASTKRRLDAVDFEQVYRLHVAFVWRSLCSMGVADAALEDATHEVFVVVHRRWGDFDGRSRMTTWLFGIAKGVARNVARGQRRTERRLSALRVLDGDAGIDPSADPISHMDTMHASSLLERFLDDLDPEKRAVFELCEVEGLPVVDAARCLSINSNTAA